MLTVLPMENLIWSATLNYVEVTRLKKQQCTMCFLDLAIPVGSSIKVCFRCLTF